MASPGTSPAGSANDPPACSSRAAKRLAPTLSSTATAGTFSESCKARRTVTVPWKREIEILRRIAAEADGAILDQRVGMDEAILEAEPIDERLEGRARRAHRRGHIDLAGAAGIEIVRRGDAREHLAAAHDRPRGSRPRCRVRARARARAQAPRDSSAASRRWSGDEGCDPAQPRAPRRPHAAPASASACVRPAPARASRARSRPKERRRPRRRDRARGRAHCAPRRRSGRGGAAPAIAASATSMAASPSVRRRGSLPK